MVTLLGTLLCSAETVNLNFFANGTKIHTEHVASGGTYTLTEYVSNSSMSAYVCRDYSFVGWKVGEPVVGDETPSMSTTVTPTANTNLYAVFHKETNDRYLRITETDNLEAGAKYLIICYYMYGGEPQYYALGNVNGTYTYKNTTYTNLNAERLYPHQGVIINPDNSLVWTLGGTSGAWTWHNGAAGKSLYIRSSASYYMLQNEEYASKCIVEEANGVFSIKDKDNNYFLKYVDDEITETEDYFITGTSVSSDNYRMYLYKKENPYTSYPDCDAWTVYLDAVDGTITGKEPASELDTLKEASANAGVTLPTATVEAGSCSDWSFAGWHIDEPVSGTTTLPTLYTGSYTPIYNGVTLYATYKNGLGGTYYERITNASDIKSGETYIIATADANNYAVKNTVEHSKYFGKKSMSVSDGIIFGEDADVEWTFDGTRFKNGSTYLSYSGGTNYYYYVNNSTSPFVLKQDYSGGDYYLNETTYNNWGTTHYVFGEKENSSKEFYIYHKRVTSYFSYPHCAPYTATLHACGGRVNGEENVIKTEASAGGGFVLPEAAPLCSGWTFVGWLADEELASLHDVEFTDCHLAGATFYPTSDHMDLYAVYSKPDDRFRIIHGPSQIVSGDTYLITHYASDGSGDGKSYDFVLSSVASGSYLTGVKGVAPQNGEGYYMLASDSTLMWTLTGSGSSWQIVNLQNGEYLKCENGGAVSTTATATNTTIVDCDGFAMNIGYSSAKLLSYSDGVFQIVSSYTSSGNRAPWCYVYRRVKEFASWPHCDPFTVHFNACGGNANDAALTEAEMYSGVELPEAYANSDCAKEGWSFVGWAEAPVNEETDLQTFNLHPAHSVYHPASTTDTLYAVYYLKTEKFKRISTSERLFTGTKYIIATSGNRALANEQNNPSTPTSVTSVAVSPDASHIITNTNSAIEWQLRGVRGEYELYNVARDVYLDLSEPGKVLLTKSEAVDQFDITYSDGSYIFRSVQNISGTEGHKYMGYSSPYFTSVASGSEPTLHIYRQQSNYSSYPECVKEIEALAWGADENGNYVIMESYLLNDVPDVNNSFGEPIDLEDGTYKVYYNTENLTSCSRTMVEWNGVSGKLKVPYVVTADANSSTMLGGSDCAECDVYVMPGKSLTINADKEIHTLTVTDGAVLNVANGVTLTVNALVLFAEGDQSAPVVNLNNTGSIVLKHGELYHDRRMDESRYFWFSLPYDAKLKEISYSNLAANGKAPVYRQDYFLKYYNGAKRTADANAGTQASTYWTHVAAKGENYTLRAGQGYIIGIADQWGKTQDDGKQHAKRVIRFTMRPETATWLTQERNGGTKTTDVAPSAAIDSRNARYAGWNLIGNPFMHGYNTGAVGAESGLVNGAWKQELDAKGDWTGRYVEDDEAGDVPYFTLYDESKPYGENYSQVLAANYDMRPFEAVFVQISEGEQVSFASAMSVPAYAPAYRRMAERERPLYTGIVLSGEGRTDRAGIVLSDDFTPAYEIGADLAKEFNKGGLNLYTLNPENHELAFNGLADEDAVEAIPVGITFPKAGTYTFAFDDQQYDKFALDTLQLIDLVEQTTTNLLLTDYTFTAGAGTLNNRFQLLVRRAHHAPAVATKVGDTTDGQNSGWTKLIRDGQLFIRRDDTMYDATGRSVR